MSKTSISQRLRQVADRLEGADKKLPKIRGVHVGQSGDVTVYVDTPDYRLPARVRSVALWAKDYDVPVKIEMSYSAYLTAQIYRTFPKITLRETVSTAGCYELGRLIGREMSPGAVVEVTADELLAAFPAEKSAVS